MGRRTWIKIYTDKWLRGSLRKEEAMTRAIFIDLLALAGDSAYGDSGTIKLADGVGFTDETIAGMLNIPLKTWIKEKETLSNHEIIAENRIIIHPLNHGFSVEIINWKKYQSEYERQKPMRKQKKVDSVTPRVTQKVQRDRDREGDRDIDKKENISLGNKEAKMRKQIDIKKHKAPTNQMIAICQTEYRKHYDGEMKIEHGKDGKLLRKIWLNCLATDKDNAMAVFRTRVEALFKEFDITTIGGINSFWNSGAKKKTTSDKDKYGNFDLGWAK